MVTSAKDITFIIPGQTQPAAIAAGATRGRSQGVVKASVHVGADDAGRIGTQRGSGEPVRVTARPGEDVVVLTIANGPTLVLHPEDARDLLRAQAGGATRSAVDAGVANTVVVSKQLGWPGLEASATRGATRGWMGQAVLSAFEVVTGLLKDPAVNLATAAITTKVDGAVEAGVYKLSADALPKSLKGSGLMQSQVAAAADGGPLLVLLHGTFVDTVSTFGKLWSLHPQTVRALFGHYGDRVYALDHPTMGESPIANALTLVRALPAGARLHLVTHSRGGLVAEVLARACGGTLGTDELALFAGAKYSQHRTDLKALAKMALAKGLKVERVVRVACPARGTLLASKRFDAYLSVLKWGLELGGVSVAPQLVDFLYEVARRRADPAELPGIEAMMPESPVVAWLNTCEEMIPGELRVIAGDMQGDSIGSWVKTLLSDAFYWTDNDLVVQTRSMYGGAPRVTSANGPGASFLLDRGGKVTHFSYFANDRTVAAITSALTDAAPADFAVIGPLSWAGQDASGLRGAKAVARSRGGPGTNPADRPAVFVLPGILGSNLKLDGKRIWLGFRFVNGLKKLAWDPATAARVEPDGPVGNSYDDLIERLADTHEVIPFAYDWRRPIEDEARRLAAAVDVALVARNVSRKPVRLIAHSMGGLVARTMQLENPDTWKRMMARDGARLLMLGSPNGGSWSPMQTLSGDDTFGNALVAFGSLLDNAGARKMLAGMPGFIQLQASLLDPTLGLDNASTWQKLADADMAALRERSIWHDESTQRTIYEWGAPPQGVLDQAVALRRRLDAQVAGLGTDAQKMLLVIGHADFTPAGFVMGPDGLEYLNTPDGGDGRVPLTCALLSGVRTWKVEAVHGKLPDVASAFSAYVELLIYGQTGQLDPYNPPAVARGVAGRSSVPTLVRSRPSHGLLEATPPQSEGDVMMPRFATDSDQPAVPDQSAAINVVVLNGDLKFVHQPLMIGHYRSSTLTGTEWVLDRLVDHSMTDALKAGLYPDLPGSHQIFGNERLNTDNPFQMARPKAAIVVGLGEEGNLRESELAETVRQAVMAYSRQLAEPPGPRPIEFELAATLIGSGGTRITAGSAARRIVEGAVQANIKLQKVGWPRLSQLTFVEMYLDRASEAWRALMQQKGAASNGVTVARQIVSGPGAKRRPLESSYRSTSYDFISAVTDDRDPKRPAITFTLDTKRARTEVHAQHAQATLLRSLVRSASNDANTDPLIRRTLFNLLVPIEMETFLGGSGELVIEVDRGTASIPWELIDTRNPEQDRQEDRFSQAPEEEATGHIAQHFEDEKRRQALPWSIRCKLIRKLQLENFRAPVFDARIEDRALVIGEPKCDPAVYPRLPGAQREALAVAHSLSSAGLAGKVSELTSQNDAQTIINALYERPYRIVHIAGHGQEGPDGGVVLSDPGTFLGANEVRAMRTVPELVFLNCCHLAERDAATTLAPRYDRAAFAANIAEELIRVGVRCVIAAGWAVEDVAATAFAAEFYACLVARRLRFIDAVAGAREKAHIGNPSGNTWAAYQCYGDPEWTWRQTDPVWKVNEQFGSIASPMGLILALDNLALDTCYLYRRSDAELDLAMGQVGYLEDVFGKIWGEMGAVAEAFGLVYAEARNADKSIAWYRIAVNASDGGASFRAAEQLGSQLVRRGDRLKDLDEARHSINEGIVLLQNIAALRPTVETKSLLGSAYKRTALIEGRAGRQKVALQSLKLMVREYAEAEAIARQTKAGNLFYPAKNSISAELRLAFLQKREPTIATERLSEVQASLDQAAHRAPDFWSVVGQTELRMLEALAQSRLVGLAPELIEAFRALKARVPSLSMWDSVYNEAQFTLVPYLDVAGAEEKRAAHSLLDALKAMTAA